VRGVLLDVTERKSIEQELMDYRLRLEQLVATKTTELEASQSRLRVSDRMAALGTLAAGIGHDIANILLPVRARIEAMDAACTSKEMEEDLRAIHKSAEYLQNLARGLRLFAVDPDSSRDTTGVDLEQWKAEVESLLRNVLPRNAALRFELVAGLPPVNMTAPALTQTVFNLVQNAGRAVMGTRAALVRVIGEPSPVAGHVRIRVVDNGPGMSEEVKARCMDPFFTTRTRGLSTGLGLSLVHAAVTRAGGTIGVESAPGQGASFTLDIPAVPNSEGRREPVHVRIDIKDERLMTFAAYVARSVGLAVANGGTAPVRLWIADRSVPTLALERFLIADSSACVLDLAGRSDLPQSPRVFPLKSAGSGAELRHQIEHAAEAINRRGAVGEVVVPGRRNLLAGVAGRGAGEQSLPRGAQAPG
jgi:nitrogen-specific signal transduction histidine kinase